MGDLKTWIIGGAIMAAGLAAAQAASTNPPPQVAQCAGCHQANGMGNPAAGFPALAGQPAGYLEQQLYAFKHGSRQNHMMKSFAGGLNDASRKAVAAYFSQLPVVAPATLPAAPKGDLGATLATKGAGAGTPRAIPACDSCHGAGGLGRPPEFPRLAGQPEQYLANQLTAWQKGSRNETNLHLMRDVAVNLSPKQIKAVAAYFAALPPTSTSPSSNGK
ncbi:c-type cytochrome [Acidiphilium sp. AL]|uniref:C-type cytochrome n=1 Tax=Acidiphilium iwatense TaxID=768198 RepID=A0ABS9E488_9PROT|nr:MULTISPECIES: c-type cytochrome [Acidiphilium]MCF3948462.1 c-type cytochrome [Acidiphilium iwatense]MCU4158529.1 c-type cytochrome [Acidiphilium sp. AL]